MEKKNWFWTKPEGIKLNYKRKQVHCLIQAKRSLSRGASGPEMIIEIKQDLNQSGQVQREGGLETSSWELGEEVTGEMECEYL